MITRDVTRSTDQSVEDLSTYPFPQMLADFQWFGIYLRICDFLEKIGFLKKIGKYILTLEFAIVIFFVYISQ